MFCIFKYTALCRCSQEIRSRFRWSFPFVHGWYHKTACTVYGEYRIIDTARIHAWWNDWIALRFAIFLDKLFGCCYGYSLNLRFPQRLLWLQTSTMEPKSALPWAKGSVTIAEPDPIIDCYMYMYLIGSGVVQIGLPTPANALLHGDFWEGSSGYVFD